MSPIARTPVPQVPGVRISSPDSTAHGTHVRPCGPSAAGRLA